MRLELKGSIACLGAFFSGMLIGVAFALPKGGNVNPLVKSLAVIGLIFIGLALTIYIWQVYKERVDLEEENYLAFALENQIAQYDKEGRYVGVKHE